MADQKNQTTDKPLQYVGGPRDGEITCMGTTYHQENAGRRDGEGYTLFHTYAQQDGQLRYLGLLPSNEGKPVEPREPVYPEQSSALKRRSEHYPAAFNGRVPRRVRLLQNVRPCGVILWIMSRAEIAAMQATAGDVVDVTVNSHGAVTAILPGWYQLGLRPREFEVVEWHPDQPPAAPAESQP